MAALTCPIPHNINPLQSNGFMFSILKLPEVSYFCQTANIPGISAPSAQFETPLTQSPIPGEKVVFGEMSISFMIDEEMSNYMAIHDWIIGLTYPADSVQYQQFISKRTNEVNTSELTAGYSDAVLQVLNSSNNVARTVQFVDVFPVQLGSVELQSTTDGTNYLVANATFEYTYYSFV
jgi:hypothetical protein